MPLVATCWLVLTIVAGFSLAPLRLTSIMLGRCPSAGSIMLLHWEPVGAFAIQLWSFDASDHSIRMLVAEEVHHFVGVLANELLRPIASCVMPTHPVAIPVIVDSKAGFYGHPGTL